MRHFFVVSLLSFSLVASLTACSKKDIEQQQDSASQSTATLAQREAEKAEKLYNQALAELDEGSYKSAIEKFHEVETSYPYAKEAGKSLLMAGFAQYKAERYNDAVVSLDKFISLYPSHDMTSYAYYLKALSSYDQIVDVGRDQQITMDAQKSLADLIARFPDSDYAQDAQIKIDLVQDHLAGKEMEIGYFYQRHGNLISAINRFRVVIRDYQTTSHVPEALYRLSASYYALGIEKEAINYAAVLGHNYPESKWYKHAYALLEDNGDIEKLKEPSWVDRFWIFSKKR
ncbi:MAG: outer membrane protein assembly factor BamD [Rickettsiales bacterium]|nr:outer membrane protein assembly factor BamD [Rickettsiales bacterium]